MGTPSHERKGMLNHDFLFCFQSRDAVEKDNGDFPLLTVARASPSSGPCFVLCRRGVYPFGIIVGTVTDPTGATLSAATVTVTNTETQGSQTVVTSGTGDYSGPGQLWISRSRLRQLMGVLARLGQKILRSCEGSWQRLIAHNLPR